MKEPKEYKTYHKNGKLEHHYFSRNGQCHGEHRLYHDNGQLATLSFIYNKYHGKKEFFRIDGSKAKKQFYIKGWEVKSFPFLPQQKPLSNRNRYQTLEV